MFGRPNDMTEAVKAERERVRREGRVKKIERDLTPSQFRAYRRWLGACDRTDVPITTETRFEFLSDLKEDVTS